MDACGDQLQLTVEFGGGIDTYVKDEHLQLVDGAKKAIVKLPRLVDNRKATIRKLISFLGENYFKSSPELFCTDVKIRPGILVIINDVDWEITEDGEDKYDYELQDRDCIVFVSTLHGG